MSLFSARKHRRLTIIHVLATVQTFVKAYDKLSHEKYVVGGILAVLALIMLFYSVFHTQIEHKRPMALPFFFLFEAIVLGLVAYLSYGKGYFILYVISSVLYTALFVYYMFYISRKLKEQNLSAH